MQVTISDAIRYIGVDDKDIDLFESQYVVPEGVSYNSYVILDEKIAVMDTVDARGMEGWEDKLLQTLNGKKPDYLIISHLEPDHAGSIGRMVELFPEVKLVASAKAIAMLRRRRLRSRRAKSYRLEPIHWCSIWHRWYTGRRSW